MSLNSQAIKKPKIIYDAVRVFGKSTIVANIEVLKKNNNYFCYYNNGRTPTNLKAEDWIIKLQKLGVGEIILTFIDYDGTGKGFDFTFINKIKNSFKSPLVISGGAGNIQQIKSLFKNTNTSGVALSSFLHYNLIQGTKLNEKDFLNEGNIDFISKNSSLSKKFENILVQKIFKKLNRL